MGLLARAVIIATRWPYLAEAVLADPDFIVWLGRAREVQKELARLRSQTTPDADEERVTQARIRVTQARLDAYLADSRLKRHIGADDLNKILMAMSPSKVDRLRQYLQLARLA